MLFGAGGTSGTAGAVGDADDGACDGVVVDGVPVGVDVGVGLGRPVAGAVGVPNGGGGGESCRVRTAGTPSVVPATTTATAAVVTAIRVRAVRSARRRIAAGGGRELSVTSAASVRYS